MYFNTRGARVSPTEGVKEGPVPEARTPHVHWHVLFTHFPISLFGTAFLFQLLHLFTSPAAFELAGTVCLLVGAAAMIPATISGWFTWRRYFHGVRNRIFRRKIWTAVGMLVISVPFAAWRTTLYYSGNQAHGAVHVVYFILSAMLIAGAVVEGYYGGHLAHR